MKALFYLHIQIAVDRRCFVLRIRKILLLQSDPIYPKIHRKFFRRNLLSFIKPLLNLIHKCYLLLF